MAVNIAYVHGVGEIGGAERDLLSYIDLLDRCNFQPHVVCPGKGSFVKELIKKQVPVAAIYVPPWRKLKGVIKLPLAVLKLIRIFSHWKIDLVHVNDYWWFPQTYLAAKICRIPIVVHLRQQIEPKRIKQYWLKKPNYLFPVSADIECVLLEMGVDADRVRILYSGISFSNFGNLKSKEEFRCLYSLKENQIIIGTVANLFPRKGYEYLIEALVEVKEHYPQISCFIIGEGSQSYRKQLVRLVEKKGLSSNVIFAGFQENVYDFLNSFDLFVLPSLMEGFGIALLEAMAMSKPIVASNVGGVPEVIAQNITGVLVPPKDSKSLANAIVRMLADDSMRQRLGLAARKTIETKFTQDIAMRTMQNYYYTLLAKSSYSEIQHVETKKN